MVVACKHCVKCNNTVKLKRLISTGGSMSNVTDFIFQIYCRDFCFSCAGMANGMDWKSVKRRGAEEWRSSWKSC
jgi:hypothetical protein